jgi:hypothetical protein
VALVDGFQHLDAAWRAVESTLPVAEQRGLLGAWTTVIPEDIGGPIASKNPDLSEMDPIDEGTSDDDGIAVVEEVW